MHIPTILGITASCSIIAASGLVIYNQVKLLPNNGGHPSQTATLVEPAAPLLDADIQNFTNASIVDLPKPKPQIPKAEELTVIPTETNHAVESRSLAPIVSNQGNMAPITAQTDRVLGTNVRPAVPAPTVGAARHKEQQITNVSLAPDAPLLSFVSRVDTSVLNRFATSLDLPDLDSAVLEKNPSNKPLINPKLKHNPWQIGAFR